MGTRNNRTMGSNNSSGRNPANRHVVLLGDSTIDNAAWIDGPCVTDKVREQENVTMCARDGALIAAIREQVRAAPADGTHFVVSVGGNNATGATTTVLGPSVVSAEEAIVRLSRFVQGFEAEFSAAMQDVINAVADRPLVILSCYNPCFAPMNVTTVSQSAANTTVALLADAVHRIASRLGVPVIDLRRVMVNVEDFANAIEPSTIGGAKIAQAIVDVVRNHPFELKKTIIYPNEYPESILTQSVSQYEQGQNISGAPAENTGATSVLEDVEAAALVTNLRSGGSSVPNDVK